MNDNNNTKRIAKNTFILYFRMLLLMIVSLYTSRVVLNSLGVTDYGIYNVVGGFVVMFSVISNSISTCISRYITYELGKDDFEKLKKTFSTSVNIQIALSVIIICLAETIGLWFLNEKMVIPKERFFAANWCFQMSIITFVMGVLSVPYNAAIISHEKMSIYAYVSILEGICKLAVAVSIAFIPFDSLCIYSSMLAMLSVAMRSVYILYCKRSFYECTYSFQLDTKLLREMSSFAGWSLIGTSSYVLREQGCNIMMNIFFGPLVNAARGVANSVNIAVTNFINNFMVALNPQITKSYASGYYTYMTKIATLGTRFSFYIMLIIAIPIMINTPLILRVWLKTVPLYAVSFVRLALVLSITEIYSSTLSTIIQATGKIKSYQIYVGGVQMLNFPLSYIFLKLGFNPETVFIIAIILSLICFIIRLHFLREIPTFSIFAYFKDAFIETGFIAIICSSLPIGLYYLMLGYKYQLIVVSLFSVIWTIFLIYIFGLKRNERGLIKEKIQTFF